MDLLVNLTLIIREHDIRISNKWNFQDVLKTLSLLLRSQLEFSGLFEIIRKIHMKTKQNKIVVFPK